MIFKSIGAILMDFAKRRSRRVLAKRRGESSASDEWDIPGVDRERSALDGGSGDAELDAALAAVARSSGTIREACVDDAETLTDEATIRLLADVADVRRRLDAAYLSVVAMIDKRAAAKYAGLGVQTTLGLLKLVCDLTPGRAKADVTAARAIHGDADSAATALVTARENGGPLSEMGGLLAEGAVSMAHVDTAVRTLDQVPERLLNATLIRNVTESDTPVTGGKGADVCDGDDAGGEREPTGDAGEEHARVDGGSAKEDAGDGDDARDGVPGLPGSSGWSVREEICDFFARTAPSTSPGSLRQLGKHLVNVLEPDTDDHFDPESYARRSMTMSTDITGMVFGTYQLDPVAGAALRTILDPLAAPRPAQTSDDGTVLVRDTRTPNQRRADALSDLASAAAPLAGAASPSGGAVLPSGGAASPSDGTDDAGGNTETAGEPIDGLFELRNSSVNGPETNGEGSEAGTTVGPSRAAKLRPGRRPTRITVVTTVDKLVGSDSTPSHCFQTGDIDQGTLARLSCDATFERLILDSRDAVLDMGMPVRLATPAQKRAISARDKGCVFPGCDRPPSWCDVHHVQWYSRGGPTDVNNLCLLCEHHHTLIHTGSWLMRMIDGIPYAAPAERSAIADDVARIPDTTALDGWVRNSYFDRLKETEHLADIIVRCVKHRSR